MVRFPVSQRTQAILIAVCALGAGITARFATAADRPDAPSPTSWNTTAAARYLDNREIWWQEWPKSKRDHETVCVSCHTVLPYALSRPSLHSSLNETGPASPERVMLDNIEKRVKLWNEVLPYYSDEKSGAGKAVESRATESVVNALILASYDARSGHLSASTKAAFDDAWALQLQTGKEAGAWKWQVFHLAPWESAESQYMGAGFMALAVGMAPDGYRKEAKIQSNLQALRSYLKNEYASQPLVNRLVVLWASAKWPELLTEEERHALTQAVLMQQHLDGGWSLAELGTWERRDHTPFDTKSDGYATGLAVLAFEEAGAPEAQTEVRKALAWLKANQDKTEGSWHAASVNKQRDPATDVGKFMSDAATGYAVLALEKSAKQ